MANTDHDHDDLTQRPWESNREWEARMHTHGLCFC